MSDDPTRPDDLKDTAGLVGVVSGRAIQRLLTQNEQPNMGQTRERAKDAREFLNGEKMSPLPKTFYEVQGDTNHFRANPAIPYQRAMNTVQTIAAKWPFAKRFTTGGGRDPEIVAEKIEVAINEVMRYKCDGRPLYPWVEAVDVTAIEAISAMLTVPDPAAWEGLDDYDDKPGSKEQGTPLPKWQRDAEGRGPKHSMYQERDGDGKPRHTFRIHREQSRKVYGEYARNWKTRKPPVSYRLLGPQEFCPIWNADGSLAALIVEQKFRESELIRKRWFWGTGAHLSPTGDSADGTGDTDKDATVTRLEHWGYDLHGKPYVSYCILDKDGAAHAPEKYVNDGLVSTTIDLSPFISRLPIAVGYGLQWAGVRDKDKRPVTITQFTMQDHLNVAAMKTGGVVSTWSFGFPSGWFKRDPELGDPETPTREMRIDPLMYKEIDGDITHNQINAFPDSAVKLIQMDLDDASQASPSDAASGGGGSSSGFDRSLAAGFAETAQFSLKDGPRGQFELSASYTLEILSNWAEANGPVPILTNPPTPVGTVSKVESRRKVILEFEAEWAGGVYDMTAIFKPERGENLAKSQVNLEKVKQKVMTRRDYLELDGVEDPEFYEAQLKAEELEATPYGQVEYLETIAEMSNNDKLAQLAKAEKANLLAKLAPGMSQDQALPRGLGSGVTPPPGMMQPPTTPGVPGTHVGNPVAASNAAAVGAALQTGPMQNAQAAGGALPVPVGASPGVMA